MKMLNKSKLYVVVLISVFLSNTNIVFSQGGPEPPPSYEPDGPEPPPDFEPDGPEPPPAAAPINQFLIVLFAVGATYAGRKFYLNQNNSDKD